MITMTKRLEFDAGHRLMNHESKCRNVHGHRYAVEVTVALTADGALDHAGRIVDFGDVKRLFGAWLDEKLDHGFIANALDFDIITLLGVKSSKVYVVDFEPSAENLADHLLGVARSMLDAPGRRVTSLVVYETPTSRAEAT